MKTYKNLSCENSSDANVRVSVDVTKIVKYSCISSVLIILIIFGSKVLNQIYNK